MIGSAKAQVLGAAVVLLFLAIEMYDAYRDYLKGSHD